MLIVQSSPCPGVLYSQEPQLQSLVSMYLCSPGSIFPDVSYNPPGPMFFMVLCSHDPMFPEPYIFSFLCFPNSLFSLSCFLLFSWPNFLRNPGSCVFTVLCSQGYIFCLLCVPRVLHCQRPIFHDPYVLSHYVPNAPRVLCSKHSRFSSSFMFL